MTDRFGRAVAFIEILLVVGFGSDAEVGNLVIRSPLWPNCSHAWYAQPPSGVVL